MTDLISIELVPVDKLKATCIINGPKRQRLRGTVRLPWTNEAEWTAVFAAMNGFSGAESGLSGKSLERAIKLGLVDENGDFTTDRLKRIGEVLYRSLIRSAKDRGKFESWLDEIIEIENTARNRCAVVQLHLGNEGSFFHAYPWELLCNDEGQKFFFNTRSVQLTRNIDLSEPYKSIPSSDNLHIILADPRPNIHNYDPLPDLDRPVLEELEKTYGNELQVHKLSGNVGGTLDLLFQFFQSHKNDDKRAYILHIDAHGSYGWLCNKGGCRQLNPPRAEKCGCGYVPSRKRISKGYLAFDDGKGDVTWVEGEDLAVQLVQCPIQLVVLSACKSGQMGGTTPFNSIAGALVQHHIPAVIAIQNTIEATAGKYFTHGLYSEMVSNDELVDCLAEARVKMYTRGNGNEDWYRPVLYINADPSNSRGRLFRDRINFKRNDFLSLVRRLFEQYQPGENRFRMRNFYAPNGLGKTNTLRSAFSTLRKEYLILYMPLKQYLDTSGMMPVFNFPSFQVDLLREIRIRLSERAGVEIVAEEKLPDENQLPAFLIEVTRRAESVGHTVRVLLDDFDILLEQDARRFNDFVLQPLSLYTQVIITSTGPVGLQLKRNLGIPVETSEMPRLPVEAVIEQLPLDHQSIAKEIHESASGFPMIMRVLVAKVKESRVEVLNETPDFYMKLRQELLYEQQRPAGQEMISEDSDIHIVLALLRWFNLNTLKILLPKLFEKDYHDYNEQNYLQLLQGLGGQVEWSNQGGGWRIQAEIKKVTYDYYSMSDGNKIRRIHQVAHETYHQLLWRDPHHYQPELLIEMLYHQLELMKIADIADDHAEFSSKVKKELDKYFQHIDTQICSNIDFQELNNLLKTDVDLRCYLLDTFEYQPSSSVD